MSRPNQPPGGRANRRSPAPGPRPPLRLVELEEHSGPSGFLTSAGPAVGNPPAVAGPSSVSDTGPPGGLPAQSPEQSTPDLATDGFVLLQPPLTLADPVLVEFAVRNVGDAASGPATATVYRSGDRHLVGTSGGPSDDTPVASVEVPPLEPGQVHRVTLEVGPLPEVGGEGFLLLGVAGGDDAANNANRGPNIDSVPFTPVFAAAEAEPNDETAQLIPLRTEFTGSVDGPADVDLLRVRVPGQPEEIGGSFEAELTAEDPALDPRVRVLTADGRLLAQSDDVAPGDTTAKVALHVPPGDYLLQVSAEEGAGPYRLGTRFTEALPPLADMTIPDPTGGARFTTAVETGDFDGDRVPDLVTVNRDEFTDARSVSVLRGVGDGSFRPPVTTPVGGTVGADVVPPVAVAHLNADGRDDVVVGGQGVDEPVTVLLSRGDGTFDLPAAVPVGGRVERLLTADVSGDGRADLVAVSLGGAPDGAPAVVIRLGRGDGTFLGAARAELGPPAAGATRADAAVADADGDGDPDLVAGWTAGTTGRLVVLGNAGDGTFAEAGPGRTGFPAGRLAVGDFTGDGLTDVVANGDANDYRLITIQSDGTFTNDQPLSVTDDPNSAGMMPTDLDEDARRDLVVGTADPVLLRGSSLAPAAAVPRRADRPGDFAAADFDRDGRTDLVVIDEPAAGDGGTVLTVHTGLGDGTVAAPPAYATGAKPGLLVGGDLNADGFPDVVSVAVSYETPGRPAGPTYSVFLGRAGGGFAGGPRVSESVAVNDAGLGDLNGDGLPDLVAVGNRSPGTGPIETVILTRAGLGQGEFAAPAEIPIGPGLYALLLADVTGDQLTDVVLRGGIDFDPRSLAAPPPSSSALVVLPGRGDGGFGEAARYTLGVYPYAIAAADIDRDGHLDLAVGGRADAAAEAVIPPPERIDFFHGGPAGLTAAGSVAADPGLTALELTDVGADGITDLVTWDRSPGAAPPDQSVTTVRVRHGVGDGSFDPIAVTAVEFGAAPPTSPAYPPRFRVADLNGDGWADVAVPDPGTRDFVVALGKGDGTFETARRSGAAGDPDTLVAADVNGDQIADLLTADPAARAVRVHLGGAVGDLGGSPTLAFAPSLPDRAAAPAGAVAVVDLTGDGRPDTLAADQTGDILFYKANPDGTPAAPQVVNPGRRATDYAVIDTPAGRALAAVGADGALTVYRRSGEVFTADSPVPVGRLSGRVAAANLNDDPYSDLVVANTLDDTLTVFLSGAADGFPDRRTLPAGGAPTTIRFADVNADSKTDVVALNRAAADLGVYLNPVATPDPVGQRFRAAPSAVGFVGGPAGRAVGGPSDVVLGGFDGLNGPDAVVVLGDLRQAVFLSGSGVGGFVNPGAEVPLGPDPGPAAAADFDGNGTLDLAVVIRGMGEVWVLDGDGRGAFGQPHITSVGPDPTGLTVTDLNADGAPDLVVGDRYGRLTRLLNVRGEGFAPERPATAVPLAVADINADGVGDVALANQATGEVRVLARRPGGGEFDELFRAAGETGARVPTAVLVADMNQDGLDDLVIADAGRSGVRVYPGLGSTSPIASPDGRPPPFADPIDLPTGARPAGLAVADVSGEGVPDLLVANEGSNDVSVLLGSGAGADWRLIPGPRIRSGGRGPVGIAVRDQTGDATTDLVVVHADGDTISVVAGVGGGFFRAVEPDVLTLPGGPGAGGTAIPVIDPDTGTGFAVGAGENLRVFDLTAPDAVTTVNVGNSVANVVRLQPISMPDDPGRGRGLLTTTETGLITLYLLTSDGGLELVSSGKAPSGESVSAAVGVPADLAIDVYVTRVGSSVPSVLSLDTVTPVQPPPPMPPPLPPDPGPEPGQEDTAPPTDGTAAALVVRSPARTDIAVAAAPGERLLGSPDALPRDNAAPAGEEPSAEVPGDESSTEWELFYLDNLRRLERFSRPGAAPADPSRGPRRPGDRRRPHPPTYLTDLPRPDGGRSRGLVSPRA